MPQYSFKCDKCNSSEIKNMTITEFLKTKKIKIKCSKCSNGALNRQINLVFSEIERNKEELKIKNKEEVQEIVKKIRDGDERTIRDIYGDKPNK